MIDKDDPTRQFVTGATRGADDGKLDYEGFLSPIVLERFAKYMHEFRLRNVPAGQTIRGSDNWQRGIPVDAYMKSLLRHVVEVWRGHRGKMPDSQSKEFQDALCALMFNAMGYLFELLKHDA